MVQFKVDSNFFNKQTLSTGSRSKLCDITDWEDEEFCRLAAQIMSGQSDEPQLAIKHRKLWEFTKAVQSFQHAGVWRKDAIGISVAGGSERFLFYAANQVARIVSADIYGRGGFASSEADAHFYDRPEDFAPYSYPKNHLHVVCMNALKLEFPEGLFDFASCFSSIEHLGTFGRAKRAVREIARVLKPGGVLALTTECSINGVSSHEVFHPRQIRKLIEDSGLTLLGDLDLLINEESLNYLCDIKRDSTQELPHINIKHFASIFTSVSLALVKPKDATPNAQPKRIELLDEIVAQHRAVTSIDTANKVSILQEVWRSLRGKTSSAKCRLLEKFISTNFQQKL